LGNPWIWLDLGEGWAFQKKLNGSLRAREEDENGVEWGDDQEAEVGLLLVR